MKKSILFYLSWINILCLLSCDKMVVEEDKMRTTIPNHLCIYYGYPSLINNANGDLNKAISEFSRFDLIVLGDGLSKATHPDNISTQKIIDGIITNKKVVFGYVDLGVSTNNYSIEELKVQIDSWKKIKAEGIFFDDAGFDYKVTKERQSTIVKYCKSQNLKVFMNAWNPDDVMDLLDEDDFYLAESFLVGHDKYLPLADWKIKADKCYDYMLTKGVKIACIATGGESINAGYNTSDKFSMAWTGTAMYNFPYFQVTNLLYSSNNNTVYFFPNFSDSYGKTWNQKEGILKDSDSHFYRETDTHSLHIYGDGNSQGYGKITKLQ